MTVKAYGLPTGTNVGGSLFTPPHYGRSDYTHRWAAQSLRGIIAHGGAPAYLPDMGSGGIALSCYSGTTFQDATVGKNPYVSGRTITITSSPDDPNTNTSIWCVNVTGDAWQVIRTPGRVYTTAAGGVMYAGGNVNTSVNVLGWHVVGIVNEPTQCTLFVDGVKKTTTAQNASAATQWSLQPLTGTGDHYLGEIMAWSGLKLPDADVIAISKAMMAERGL